MLLKWMTAFPKGLETKRAGELVCAGKVRGLRRCSEGVLQMGQGCSPQEESLKPQPASLDFWPG